MTPLLLQYTITAPESLAGDFFNSISYKFNWTEEFRAEYTEKRMFGSHTGNCGIREDTIHFDITYPENLVEYVPPNQCEA